MKESKPNIINATNDRTIVIIILNRKKKSPKVIKKLLYIVEILISTMIKETALRFLRQLSKCGIEPTYLISFLEIHAKEMK